jgi:hypothetical protein
MDRNWREEMISSSMSTMAHCQRKTRKPMKTFKFYENELQPEVSDNQEGGEILGQRFLPLKVHLHL